MRVAVLWDPTVPAGIGQFAVLQSVAPSLGVGTETKHCEQHVRDRTRHRCVRKPAKWRFDCIGERIDDFDRELINTLAAKHKLPAVVPSPVYMTGGALISDGVDFIDQHRRAAGYVDRILKGEKPADLPVEAPTNTSW